MSANKLIKIMQEEGKKFNPSLPFIGDVVSVNPLKVSVGDADPLEEDQMYRLNENYTLGHTVIVYPTSNSSKFAVIEVVG